VITVSWALDLVFWEGLWAHPEDEAANIMMYILPWRVMRIVNSKSIHMITWCRFMIKFV